MRKLAIFILFMMSGIGMNAQTMATSFKLFPVQERRFPIQRDSLNFVGARFEMKDLFHSSEEYNLSADEQEQTVADKDGFVTLSQEGRGYTLQTLQTNLRADRFMKGKLEVYSSSAVQVMVDGVEKLTNMTVTGSVKNIKPQQTELRLEPETDYTVVVKILSTPKDSIAPVVKCCFTPDAAYKSAQVTFDSQSKHHFSLYNTQYGPRVYSLSVSPHGKYILITYRETFTPDVKSFRTAVLDAKTKKTVIRSVKSEARWMPVSDKLYYFEDAEHDKQLCTLDPATLQEDVILKSVSKKANICWSPTEDYLISMDSDEGEKVTGPLKRILMPDDRIPGARTRASLSRIDIHTGVQETLTYGGTGVSLQDISADGKTLLCSSFKDNITETPFRLGTLFEIDLATLKTDTLIKDEPFLATACYSPDASKVLLTASPSAFGCKGKKCSLPIANDYDVQAYILDKQTKDITCISLDFDPCIDRADWNKGDGNIYFRVTEGDIEPVYQYSLKTKRFEKLPLEQGVILTFSIADLNPSVAAYVASSNQTIGAAYAYDVQKRKSTLIADPLQTVLKNIDLGTTEPWDFTAKDGTLIHGSITLPPNFDSSRKYPLIVYYYGGTLPSTQSLTTPYSPQLFAAYDYVVYVLQPSGTVGYGQEFSARHVNAWGDYTADEIIEGTKKFCEAHSFIDAKKVGCIGASYGGFMTQYLQTKTDIFAAAVSHAGISNVTSYWGEGYWGYSYNSVAAAKSFPWSQPELFTKHGSLFNADKINTPLLLLHGTADTNVPIGESIQLYNALKILGKTVEFITVDGENHFISDYPKRVLWHNTIMAWFARWLQDRPEWWDDLYPKRNW